jgi:hypothetical protein
MLGVDTGRLVASPRPGKDGSVMLGKLGFNASQVANRKRILLLSLLTFLALC